METPRSLDIANAFMAEGRNGSVDHNDLEAPLSVCAPQLERKVGGYDLEGGIKQAPPGVDYNPIPCRLNPRSVSGQKAQIKYDGEGKPLGSK